jgi:murein hydrolase activator
MNNTSCSDVTSYKEELSKVSDNITRQQNALQKIKQKETIIDHDISSVDKKLNTTKTKLKKTALTINKIDRDYKKTAANMENTTAKIEALKQIISYNIQYTYEQGLWTNSSNFFNKIISLDSSTKKEYLRYWVKTLFKKNSYLLTELVTTKNKFSKKSSILEEKKYTLISSKKKYLQLKKGLKKKKDIKLDLLKKIKEERVACEQKINQLNKSSKVLQSFIDNYLKKAKIPLKEKSITEKKFLNFISEEGHINKPVSGEIITYFGKQKHPKFDIFYINNGIEIGTKTKQNVSAVKNGVIVFAGNFGTYGKTIIIEHKKNLHTIYAYLSSIQVSQNQKILKGTILGTSGISPIKKIPALHFEVRYNGYTIDPIWWLNLK